MAAVLILAVWSLRLFRDRFGAGTALAAIDGSAARAWIEETWAAWNAATGRGSLLRPCVPVFGRPRGPPEGRQPRDPGDAGAVRRDPAPSTLGRSCAFIWGNVLQLEKVSRLLQPGAARAPAPTD
jgi:hypothetical protein